MTDPTYLPPGGDGGPDDLPRTLRREREAREREARERTAAASHPSAAPQQVPMSASYGVPEPSFIPQLDEQAPAARVTRFDVPFLHLVAFFIKASLAAIPGLLLLGAILWVVGHLAQTFFPQLVKLQILIWFPNNT